MIWCLCSSFLCKCSTARLPPALCLSPGVIASSCEGESIKSPGDSEGSTAVRQKKCCVRRLCVIVALSLLLLLLLPIPSLSSESICVLYSSAFPVLLLWRWNFGPLRSYNSCKCYPTSNATFCCQKKKSAPCPKHRTIKTVIFTEIWWEHFYTIISE